MKDRFPVRGEQPKTVRACFEKYAPELVQYLKSDDPFWSQISNNSISDEDLVRHLDLVTQSGLDPCNSDVARAIYLLADLRRTELPTPIPMGFSFRTPRN